MVGAGGGQGGVRAGKGGGWGQRMVRNNQFPSQKDDGP